jgi:hypothetical protein
LPLHQADALRAVGVLMVILGLCAYVSLMRLFEVNKKPPDGGFFSGFKD